MLDSITPVILTMNEEPNLRRLLAALDWARDIVVVDSGSSDATLAILAEYPAVRVFHRPFDTHGNQWRYAVTDTGVTSDWVLRMDADYIVTPELRDELAVLTPLATITSYRIDFGYAIFGRRLSASLYPSNIVLFRGDAIEVFDKGHTEGWRTTYGTMGRLAGKLVHDDWKPMKGWIGSQARYMERELPHLKASPGGLKHRLRLSPPLMPIVMFLYTLFGRGMIFNGRAGLFYALQRLLAETALALFVLEDRMHAERAAEQTRSDENSAR